MNMYLKQVNSGLMLAQLNAAWEVFFKLHSKASLLLIMTFYLGNFSSFQLASTPLLTSPPSTPVVPHLALHGSSLHAVVAAVRLWFIRLRLQQEGIESKAKGGGSTNRYPPQSC